MNKIDILPGMGTKTSQLFYKLGIETVEDLLYYYPRKYQVIKRSDVRNLNDGDRVIIDGMVDGQPTMISLNKGLKKIMFRIVNERNIFNIGVYNKIYLYKELSVGMNVTIIGKYVKNRNSIDATEVRRGLLPSKIVVEPIYATISQLNRKIIAKFVDLAFSEKNDIIDGIPEDIICKYKFKDKISCMREIHHPTNNMLYKRALQRLKYEEFYVYLSKIKELKERRLNKEKGIVREIKFDKLKVFMDQLPFSLTDDQVKTVNEIVHDMRTNIRMNRLIQGDVGSGKTIVAFIASYFNYLSGYQTALMVPTEVLAVQHYQNALSLFKDFDIKIVLLTSNVRKKDTIYKKIENGEYDFIIGTQSLIQEKLKYDKLGLIITDEQHRFGVHQREVLKNKGVFPDVLSMSATPIPRTYALTIYGDMDVSSIKTKPNGRKEVITYLKKEKDISSVLHMMKKELDCHHQIYVIAPAILGSDIDDLSNVYILENKMKLAFSKITRIGVVHGKLSSEEKNKVMKDFELGDIGILISTTVIEVGVNVPNASMIVIFQANYFGLSTLHQLRGRVGRGDIQSYCILLSNREEERLKMLESCYDGFEISEYDFKMRGEGDLFGVKQSGYCEFKLANIRKDFELLKRVKRDLEY